jgi:hypothetical protein
LQFSQSTCSIFVRFTPFVVASIEGPVIDKVKGIRIVAPWAKNANIKTKNHNLKLDAQIRFVHVEENWIERMIVFFTGYDMRIKIKIILKLHGQKLMYLLAACACQNAEI